MSHRFLIIPLLILSVFIHNFTLLRADLISNKSVHSQFQIPFLRRATPTPSPSPSLSPSPTPPLGTSCSLTPNTGSAPVPATFTFTIQNLSGSSPNQTYTYDFGDNSKLNSGPTVTHQYTKTGSYTITAIPQGGASNSGCSTGVTVLAANATPLPGSAQCNSLTIPITSWNQNQSHTLTIQGTDSKGNIQGYRLRANNQNYDQNNNTFSLSLPNPGTYTLTGYVRGSDGQYVTSNACQKQVQVTTAAISEQPATGISNYIWIGIGVLLVFWLGVEIWYKLFREHRSS